MGLLRLKSEKKHLKKRLLLVIKSKKGKRLSK